MSSATRSRRILLELCEGDERFLRECIDAGILSARDELPDEEISAVLVARNLLRDLDVNWPGVEIILRLRAELLETHHQVAELLRLLRLSREG
jgi:hypothetical protein